MEVPAAGSGNGSGKGRKATSKPSSLVSTYCQELERTQGERGKASLGTSPAFYSSQLSWALFFYL